MIFRANVGSGWDLDPIRLNLCTAQHGFNPLAALIGYNKNGGALATRTAGTPGSVL